MVTPKKKHLIELMVEAGIQWPEGAEYAAQSKCDNKVHFFKIKPKVLTGDEHFCAPGGSMGGSCLLPSLCGNWHQTIVTKAQYEAAIAEKVNVDDDGWIEWSGGECPVSADMSVEVKLRIGTIMGPDHAEVFNWDHDDASGDIIAYRIISKQPATPEQKFFESFNRSIPTNTIEQRIAELRSMERHLAEFRAKLTDDLHALGITWLDSTNVADEQKQPVITDWRDLRVGDVVEFDGVDGYWPILNIENDDCEDNAPIKVSESIKAKCLVDGWVKLDVHPFRFIRRP